MTVVADVRAFQHFVFVTYAFNLGSDFFWNELRDTALPHASSQ